jgi:cysteine desulfurase family protein
MGVVYLNNAATSFPKPKQVLEAVALSLACPPTEPGRSGGGADPLAACRQALAHVFRVSRPNNIVLLPSATHALNTALLGLAEPDTHVVSTVLEHNSVLRPLAHLARKGVEVTFLRPDGSGVVSAEAVDRALRPTTTIVAITHASNVTGAVQPVEEIARTVAGKGVALVLDAAQSAGCLPIVYDELPGRVFLAFAGHKGLYGPAGTGGLVVPDERLEQSLFGGTGVRSESDEHPPELPLRHEAGTPNLPGLAGLRAGAEFVLRRTVEVLGAHRSRLVNRLRDGLAQIPAVKLATLPGADGRAGVTSLSVDGWTPEELGFALRESFGIETRSGLHCAPLVHGWLGTAPKGSIRVSVGAFNEESHVDLLVDAVRKLVIR